MDNPAPVAPWWKKGMTLKQMVLAVALAGIFAGGGAGVAHFIAKRPPPGVLAVPAMAKPATELTLVLTSPTTATSSENKLLKVTGTTLPNVPVVIFTRAHFNSGQGDETGNFEIEIELVEGTNTLTVTALTTDGQEKTVTEEVVYEYQQ
jgi:hypothetical protein